MRGYKLMLQKTQSEHPKITETRAILTILRQNHVHECPPASALQIVVPLEAALLLLDRHARPRLQAPFRQS